MVFQMDQVVVANTVRLELLHLFAVHSEVLSLDRLHEVAVAVEDLAPTMPQLFTVAWLLEVPLFKTVKLVQSIAVVVEVGRPTVPEVVVALQPECLQHRHSTAFHHQLISTTEDVAVDVVELEVKVVEDEEGTEDEAEPRLKLRLRLKPSNPNVLTYANCGVGVFLFIPLSCYHEFTKYEKLDLRCHA